MPGLAPGGLAGAFSFDAADMFSEEGAEWQPWLKSADGEMNYERDRIVARTRDLVNNDGWAAGGITRILDNAIGSQFRLVAKPDYRWLARRFDPRFDAVWADEFGRAVEAEWRIYADDPGMWCDARRSRNMTRLFYAGMSHELIDGDNIAMLLWDPEAIGYGAARYATRLALIDPDRLSNPNQQMDTQHLRGGVEIDDNGAAVAYHIRRAHQYDWYAATDSMVWDRFPRETPWGRPIILHSFEGPRATASRGRGVLNAVVTRMKMLTRYDRAELQQALLQTIFGTFIKSPYDKTDVENALGAEGEDDEGELSTYQRLREDYHRQNALTIGGARLPLLAPGEDVTTVAPTRPNSGFKDFQHAFLRNFAATTGQSAEQVSWDYSQINYSSARSAMLEAWKTLSRRRENFAFAFPNQVYSAWLEEVFDRVRLPMPNGVRLPDFIDGRAAFSRCRWIGPARGWVDPVAERQGAVLGLDAGFDTLEDQCAEQGRDYEETLDQRQVERRMFTERGLPFPEWANGVPAAQTTKKPDAE